MKEIECWKIQLYENNRDLDLPNALEESISLLKLDSVDRIKFYEPHCIIIEADPFLFVHDSTLYLFYESKQMGKPGVIKMTSTKDLISWTQSITVLKESYHLSYPFVFEDNDEVYMIPETGADKSIRLYKACDKSLDKFKFVKYIIQQNPKDILDISYCDSSILKYKGIYYLHTSIMRDGIYEMLLYTSDRLTGDFKRHPSSPICRSNKYGRNAGSLIMKDNEIYRFTQDCEHSYGENINVIRIKDLSPNTYEEEVINSNLINNDGTFYKKGGHQLNIVEFLDKTIIATDAKDYKMLLINRFLTKVL